MKTIRILATVIFLASQSCSAIRHSDSDAFEGETGTKTSKCDGCLLKPLIVVLNGLGTGLKNTPKPVNVTCSTYAGTTYCH